MSTRDLWALADSWRSAAAEAIGRIDDPNDLNGIEEAEDDEAATSLTDCAKQLEELLPARTEHCWTCAAARRPGRVAAAPSREQDMMDNEDQDGDPP